MRTDRHLLLSLATATLLGLVPLSASPARADGDPASDVLYRRRAYLPYDVAFPPRLQHRKAGFALLMSMLVRLPRRRSLAALGSATYALSLLTLLPVLRHTTALTALPQAVDRPTAITAAAATLAVVLAGTPPRPKAHR
jgi:hypothetical protein